MARFLVIAAASGIGQATVSLLEAAAVSYTHLDVYKRQAG